MQLYEVPLSSGPQKFSISLLGIVYKLTVVYRGAADMGGGWVLDISDNRNKAILCGIPLVTGADLLAQYHYLNFGGSLVVYNDGADKTVPGFTDFTVKSHLYFVTT